MPETDAKERELLEMVMEEGLQQMVILQTAYVTKPTSGARPSM
jgi:hypothetical protein